MADDVDEIDRSAKGDRLTTADASAPTPLSYAPPPLSGGTTGNVFLDAQKPLGFDQLIRLANEDAGQDTPPTQEQTEKVLPDLPTTSGPVLQGWDAPSLSNDDVDKLTTRLSGEQKQDLTDLVAQSRPPQPDSRMPEIAQTPESIMRRAFGAFANPLTLIALTAGAFTKRPALNALAAASGVIQGMNERRWQDVYLQQHKFRNSIAQVQQQMGLELADLGGIINNDRFPAEEKIARATALADQYQDNGLKAAIQKDGLAGAQSFYDNRSQLVPALRNAQNHYDSLQQRQEGLQERQREFDLRLQEMQESRAARQQEQEFRREERGEAREQKQAEKVAAEERKVLDRIPPALRNQIQDHYPVDLDVRKELGGIGPRQAVQLQSAIDSTTNLEDLAEFTVRHPGALGYLADLSRRLNADAAIDTFSGQSPNAQTKAIADQITDRHIDAASGGKNLPDAAAAKVLAKMLTTQAFNDAAAAGARGATVYLDKAFREIYQQASSPEAFFNVLGARYRSADNEMANYHMGMNRRTDIDPDPSASDAPTRRGHPFWNRGADAYVRDFREKRDQQKAGRSGQSGPREGDKRTFDEGPATFRNGKWVLD